jgi:hypothetical protein
MHPLARRLGRGKDAVEVNSQYDVFDSLFFPLSVRIPRMDVRMYVCMLAGPRASLQVLQRPCQILSRVAARIGVKSARYLRMRKVDVPDTGHRFHRVHPLSRRLSFFYCVPLILSRMLFVGGRHFRSEFATKFRVATVVTGNEAQFRHTV